MQLDQTSVIVIVVALLVAALILYFLYRSRRTASLRDRFGKDEYDRTLETRGARGAAEDDLVAREKRIAALELRPLGPDERRRFTEDWLQAKQLFVDDPAKAVLDGDRVIGAVMGTRGYPVDDFDARYESLTVDHGDVARHYRAGHDIALKQTNGTATTEDLRQAMIHYEELFTKLSDERGDLPEGAVSRQAQTM